MKKHLARRIQTTSTLTIPAPPSRVFPLLCPTREYEWLPGWSCELIYSNSGAAEQGCIFRTSFLNEGEEIWVMSGYDPESRRVEMIRFIEGSRVAHVEVSLSAAGDESTKLVWTETITALDEQGNAYVDAFSEETQAARLGFLEQALAHFCETGRILGAPATPH